jgi:hypothetical protein
MSDLDFGEFHPGRVPLGRDAVAADFYSLGWLPFLITAIFAVRLLTFAGKRLAWR